MLAASLSSQARRRLAASALAAVALGLLPALPAARPVHLPATNLTASTWLTRLNAWRANAGVPALAENTTWSAGDYNHAVYMVMTGNVTHSEVAGPYYTASGALEATKSNIQVSSSTATTDDQAIDWWMAAPFHAIGMMDPRLATTGFGSYRNASSGTSWHEGGALDVIQGDTAAGSYPVYFPGNGSTEPLTNYSGNEFPDPLSACPGYSMPTGLPVFIQVGSNVATTAGAYSFLDGTTSLPACVIDSHNPSVGSGLQWRGGVILMPRSPLQVGHHYTVAITVNAVPYTWSFDVGTALTSCSLGAGGAPTITSITPTAGSTAGGSALTVNGCGFTGTLGVKFGATAAASFSVVSDAQITAVSPAEAAGIVDVSVTNAGGTSAPSLSDRFQFVAPGVYTSVTPLRVLDTRNGPGTPLGPGGTVNVQLGGVSVPSAATSVILNVTATDTTSSSFLTLYPTGGSLPLASNLNWRAGETVANLVSVLLGTGGSVTIFNPSGYVHVIVDLEGYFAPAVTGTSGEFVTLPPARITDTRPASGEPNAGLTLAPNSTLTVQVAGAGGVPLTGVQAVVLNVTVTGTTANGGYLTAYPAGLPAPLASNVNWMQGQTVANRVVVGLGAGGKVSFANVVGSTQLVVDVNGYLTDSTASGAAFNPLAPSRILDTRTGIGLPAGRIAAGGTLSVPVAGHGGVPGMGAATPPTSVVLNVTAVGPSAAGYFVMYPDGTTRPLASDLNFVAGQIVPNLVVVKVGADGSIALFNANGTSDAVIDVEGWFG